MDRAGKTGKNQARSSHGGSTLRCQAKKPALRMVEVINRESTTPACGLGEAVLLLPKRCDGGQEEDAMLRGSRLSLSVAGLAYLVESGLFRARTSLPCLSE